MLQNLIDLLDVSHPVLIQTHDFPDHDAIGSGYALHWILTQRGFCTFLCYNGEFQSESLKESITELRIPLVPAKNIQIRDSYQIILVDGFAGNTNVTDLSGELIGIIDHHSPPTPATCKFIDIRTAYGSCASILYTYAKEHGAPIPPSVATSLLMGIMMDTAFMTRGVTQIDLEAFSNLFFNANWQRASYFLRNSLSLRDLPVVKSAVSNYRFEDSICFLEIDIECTSETLGLVSDFFLGVKEISMVISWSIEGDMVHISVRSEDPARPADIIVRNALSGIGSGGGHVHMGGGSIPVSKFPGAEALRTRFLEVIHQTKKEHR